MVALESLQYKSSRISVVYKNVFEEQKEFNIDLTKVLLFKTSLTTLILIEIARHEGDNETLDHLMLNSALNGIVHGLEHIEEYMGAMQLKRIRVESGTLTLSYSMRNGKIVFSEREWSIK